MLWSLDSHIDFKYTKILDTAIFRDTIIKGKLNLRDTIFKSDANFLDITSQTKSTSKNIIKDVKVQNRETARIIKDFYEKSNNIIEANRFYKLEMKEKSKELQPFKQPFEWLVFKLHGISSNHSQNYILALFWIFFLAFINVSLTINYNIIETFIYSFFNLGNMLNDIANKINTFSIMTNTDILTLDTLGFKVIIAYLIYQ